MPPALVLVSPDLWPCLGRGNKSRDEIVLSTVHHACLVSMPSVVLGAGLMGIIVVTWNDTHGLPDRHQYHRTSFGRPAPSACRTSVRHSGTNPTAGKLVG